MRTAALGFSTRCPFSRIMPVVAFSWAIERVLQNRACHSHLSIRRESLKHYSDEASTAKPANGESCRVRFVRVRLRFFTCCHVVI